jgi:dipeptidyl aminopeptidase/acylaminoacyl peptidase
MRTCKLLMPVSMILLALAIVPRSVAQGTRSDYERANGLRKTTENKVFRDRIRPNWLPGNDRFWYRVRTGVDRHEFVLIDAEAGTRRPAFDHERLADALKRAGQGGARPDNLPIDRLKLDLEEKQLHFRSDGRWWLCDLESYQLSEQPQKETPAPARPVSRAPKASRRTGAETEITFVNRTESEVEVFWLDFEGDRRSYGRVRAGGRKAQHTYAGHVWLVADGDGEPLAVFVAEEEPTLAEIDGPCTVDPGIEEPERRAPRRRGESLDGRWQAFVEDHNIHLREPGGDKQFALTGDGTAEDSYGRRVYWSPDSTKLVAIRTKRGEERKVYYVESSPKDQLQPKLHSYDYRKPGDRIPLANPRLFDVAARKPIPLSNELFPNPWRIDDVRWAPDSSRFTFVYNQRGHQVLRIVAVDPERGAARAVIDEKSETFIDYAFKQFAHYLDATGEIIWMSERDGWNHLYLYDAETGQVKNQITKGQWVVRRVERVDEEARQIWFRAGGIRPGQDPYYVHLCRVSFDGTGLVVLTEGDGTHSVQFSPDRRFFIDRWSRVDRAPVAELRRSSDGSLVSRLEQADWDRLLETGWRPPERFVAMGRDGKTDIYGVIFRPIGFDPRAKYPVIEQIYAGPQGAFVPKAFQAYHKAQSVAELGFIVVKIDGMGTSHRSKAFHDVCWRNLGDSGLADRIRWIRAAAEKYPCIDLARVGIYGGSAGGQSALRALLAHGDFYKVAVADCGCHDNRMDKIWWNEAWMGWPVGPHYEEQSNVTQAHSLEGKLLLIVGEKDENVDPASTMQVVDALVKADKDFDLLVLPGVGHGAAETPYGNRRRQDFFVRHLLGVEPRSRP